MLKPLFRFHEIAQDGNILATYLLLTRASSKTKIDNPPQLSRNLTVILRLVVVPCSTPKAECGSAFDAAIAALFSYIVATIEIL